MLLRQSESVAVCVFECVCVLVVGAVRVLTDVLKPTVSGGVLKEIYAHFVSCASCSLAVS